VAKPRVLVVEDDAAIRQGMVDALRFEGYDVEQAADGKAGMDAALGAPVDLVLLDLVLPGHGGLEILSEVRGSRPTLPVIIITARGAEADRVKGLRLGADDYVVKPFSIKELLARVEAVLRRSAERPTDVQRLTFGDADVDLRRQEVHHADGTRRELSTREVELLRYLAAHAGRAVSRDELLSRVWRLNPRGVAETRTIDMHVARLREKLRGGPDAPESILTVRGKGYMLAPESEQA
jgi:DNA-binding response OmpR family regulator